jgi:hypothetical protein
MGGISNLTDLSYIDRPIALNSFAAKFNLILYPGLDCQTKLNDIF